MNKKLILFSVAIICIIFAGCGGAPPVKDTVFNFSGLETVDESKTAILLLDRMYVLTKLDGKEKKEIDRMDLSKKKIFLTPGTHTLTFMFRMKRNLRQAWNMKWTISSDFQQGRTYALGAAMLKTKYPFHFLVDVTEEQKVVYYEHIPQAPGFSWKGDKPIKVKKVETGLSAELRKVGGRVVTHFDDGQEIPVVIDMPKVGINKVKARIFTKNGKVCVSGVK